MREEEEEDDDDETTTHDVQTNTLLWAYFRERYLTYPPEDLTEEKGEKKDDLEEDDVDDDGSEGGIGTYLPIARHRVAD